MPVQFAATVMTVPWRFTILGLVISTREAVSGSEKVQECLRDIQKQAEQMGAKAVIGVQVTYGMDSPKKMFQHMVTTVTGTAITWDAPTTPAASLPSTSPQGR